MRALLIALVFAVVSAKHFDILSTSDEAVRSWKKGSRAGGKVTFRVNFAMQQMDRVDEIFSRVTDFRGPDYGKYLTTEEVRAIVNPTVAQKKPVFDWLNEHSVSYTDMGGYVLVEDLHVTAAEALLQTQLYRARNTLAKRTVFAVKAFGGVTVPDSLLHILHPVYPIGGGLAVLEPPRKLAVVPSKDSPVQTAVVPQTLEVQYSINGDAIVPPYGVITQAVAEFGNDHSYSPEDLKLFSKDMEVNIEGKVEHHGPFNPSPPDAESTLDIQYIASTGRNGTSSFWVVAGWLVEWLQDYQNSQSPPEVSSISWGADERGQGAAYNEQVDNQFKALSLTGLTFLAASGDSGAPGSRSGCRTRYALNPGYPATSPYVLAVGATMFDSFKKGEGAKFETPFCQQSQVPCASSGHEVPADVPSVGFSSGGGFSTYAAQPEWQKAVVQQYLNDASIPKPPSSEFNGQNRGFPDVCALGWNIFIEIQGQAEEIGGTSASSPEAAGMLSLLNEHQKRHQKPKLGFVNPLIYAMANSTGIFSHVGSLSTNNKNGCKHGFVSGDNVKWDPICGNGVMNFQNALSFLDANTKKIE